MEDLESDTDNQRFDTVIRSWLIDGHQVSIVRSEFRYADVTIKPYVSEQLSCSCGMDSGGGHDCASIDQARTKITEEAKSTNRIAWQTMGPHEAITDIIRRVWKNSEWFGQRYQPIMYFQDLEKLLDLDLYQVEAVCLDLQQQGLVGLDQFTVFPGQQMQLIERDMEQDLRWYI